ncbi:hypothetical protein [Sinorhizobium meliloti]|nr:hypothetical protein U8C39_09690 [Sinorhizobium meliloti]WQP31728.1 hypothetical protein U8C45_09655 [Sinorhizobium meliloti]
MRGRLSGHRRILPCQPGAEAGADAGSWTALTDFSENAPITDAELDAIEAFLMAQVRAIMQETSSPPKSPEPQAKDSEAPQIPAKTQEKAGMLEVL